MNRYENQTPRATLAIAAFAMAALTLCASVIVPAAISGHAVPALKVTAPGTIDADIVPARIDVFGVREPKLMSLQQVIVPEPKMISLQPVVPATVKEQG